MITRLADPGMPENNFTLAVVDGSQADYAKWVSIQRLDPALLGGKTLIIS